jgi:hypothetical protein
LIPEIPHGSLTFVKDKNAASGGEYTRRDLTAVEADKTKYQAKIDRYEKEKVEIKAVADKLEAEATDWDKKSDVQMHEHHRWAQSTTLLQVAIALAAIALLTKRRWLEWGMFAAGAAGLMVGILAFLHI